MTQWITVTVTHTRGSVPREAGTAMQISKDAQIGTIGGGALEWEATCIARNMLQEGRTKFTRAMPLGPDLGQCCGGAVTLEFTARHMQNAHHATPLFIWGAGHVGRAVAAVLAPLQDREITLVDTAPARLPDPMPDGVFPFVAADMPRAAAHIQSGAHHLIMTYSHEIDLALCDRLLEQDCALIGLIGSHTKWARFRNRLAALGHTQAEIQRITCPIGDPALGKHPQAIAIGAASRLLSAPSELSQLKGRRA